MKGLKTTIIILLILAILGIGGYYYINQQNKNDSKNVVNNNNQTNETITEEKEEENVEEIYKEIINNYKNAKNEFEQDDTISIEEKYPLVSETLIAHIIRYKETTQLSYTYYDIDNNGTKELILGLKESNNTLLPAAVYTHNNNEVKKIYYLDTIERGNLEIYDNGILFSTGAGSATTHYYNFYKIANDGISLETLEKIKEEYITDTEVKYYEGETAKELDYNDSNEILKKYINDSKKLELTITNTIE